MQVRREAYLTNEIILRTELERARGKGPDREDARLSPIQLKEIRQRVTLTSENTDENDNDENV